MVRVALQVDEETRERLIELAGGERKIGEYLNGLVAEEYTRQTVTLERLAEKMHTLENSVKRIESAFWRQYAKPMEWGTRVRYGSDLDGEMSRYVAESNICVVCGTSGKLYWLSDDEEILYCDVCKTEYET